MKFSDSIKLIELQSSIISLIYHMLSGSIVSVSVSSSSWIVLSSGIACMLQTRLVFVCCCVLFCCWFLLLYVPWLFLCVFCNSTLLGGMSDLHTLAWCPIFFTNVTYYIFRRGVVKVTFYEFVAALPAVWYFFVVRWCWEYASSLCLLSLFLYEVYSWST